MTPEMFNLSWWEVITVAALAGMVWNELRAIRKDLARLEAKQDKYNHLQERVARVEDSCASAHHRITEAHYANKN
ncbi:MAG: hypothetical protein ACI37O_04250 [Candidatus Avelusimicrobium sp.]|uniref:hypothetical protein n=1 Tax=Candidatus Avelusimicrobium sp. TaxID=3048833 RepID=UPI003F0F2B9E